MSSNFIEKGYEPHDSSHWFKKHMKRKAEKIDKLIKLLEELKDDLK